MSEAPALPRSPSVRFPVVALLAAVAFVELVVNRVVGRLLHLEFLQPRSTVTRVVDDFGLFAFELTSVLAVLLLSAAVIRVAAHGDAFRPGARISIPLVGTVFDVLAMLGILVGATRMPASLYFHLQLSFLFLCVLLTLSAIASPADGRTRLGILLLLVTLGLRLVPSLMMRAGALAEGTPWRGESVTLVALVLAAIGCLLLVPRRGGARIASILTWTVTCAAAILMRRDWETASRVAAYGFGLELPVAPWGQLVYLGALASGLYATMRLLLVPGTSRLRGYGLLILALAGFQLELPGQLALSALGMFCLATSAVRVDGAPLSREVFDRILKQAASVIGATSVTVTGDAGNETARIHTPSDARPTIALALGRRLGVIVSVEASVGEPPPRDPPFALERRSSPGLGPHADGARVETEDPRFDGAFVIWDKRGAGAALLDEATRARLEPMIRGWLGVWPQRGVRYLARELPAGDEAAAELLALLRELHARTA